jgi:hypothetical protein
MAAVARFMLSRASMCFSSGWRISRISFDFERDPVARSWSGGLHYSPSFRESIVCSHMR